jgi:hypothetical protein
MRLENLKLERAVSKTSSAFLRSAFHMINLGLDESMERDVFDDKFENLVRLTQAFSDVRGRKRVRYYNCSSYMANRAGSHPILEIPVLRTKLGLTCRCLVRAHPNAETIPWNTSYETCCFINFKQAK